MFKEAWLRFKRFVLPRPMAVVIKYTLRSILWTCRVNVQGIDQFQTVAKDRRCILALWHNRLAILPEMLNRYTEGLKFKAVISSSRDGEPLAVVVESYSRGCTLRVPHHDRAKALLTMIQSLKYRSEVIVITPDGPRGPRYQLKPGIVMAALAAEACIVPFSWSADKYWTLKTWDGFMLPRPFSKISICFGAAITLSNEVAQKENMAAVEKELSAISL